jgi:hypothetical protein
VRTHDLLGSGWSATTDATNVEIPGWPAAADEASEEWLEACTERLLTLGAWEGLVTRFFAKGAILRAVR